MLKLSFIFFTLFLTLAPITNLHAMQIWIFNDQDKRHEHLIPDKLSGFQVGFDLCMQWGVYAPDEKYSFKEYMSWKIADEVYKVVQRKRRLAASKFTTDKDVVMVDELTDAQLLQEKFYKQLQELHPEVLNTVATNARYRLNFEDIVRANLARLTNRKKEILYKNFLELRGKMDCSN